MQPLQRTLGVLLGVLLLFVLPAWERKQGAERAERQWKEALLQRFGEELCIAGSLSAARYLCYSEVFRQGEKAYCLQIAEYQKAEDKDSNVYWCCNFWEEIEEELFGQGSYFFAGGAAIELWAVASDGEKLCYGGRVALMR